MTSVCWYSCLTSHSADTQRLKECSSFSRGQRIYFPKTDAGERRITYSGRLKDATRTVVKIRRRIDSTISYYEHEAAHWRFRRFGNDWYLLLLPGWVFTRDGVDRLLDAKRTTSLSTRRASRDYNANVVAHVWFWTSMLAGKERGAVMENGARMIVIDHSPVTAQVAGLPAAPGYEDVVQDSIRQEELQELESELESLVDDTPDDEDADNDEGAE